MEVPSKAASLFSGIFMILFGCAFAGIGVFSAAATLGQSEQTSGDNIPVLLSSFFIIVGIAIIIGGFYSFSHGAKLRERAAKYPGQPWRLKEDWASGRIKDSGVVGMIVLVVFAVIWNAIACVMTVLRKNRDCVFKVAFLEIPKLLSISTDAEF